MVLSLNVPAVEILLDNGIEYSKDFAKKLNISKSAVTQVLRKDKRYVKMIQLDLIKKVMK